MGSRSDRCVCIAIVGAGSPGCPPSPAQLTWIGSVGGVLGAPGYGDTVGRGTVGRRQLPAEWAWPAPRILGSSGSGRGSKEVGRHVAPLGPVWTDGQTEAPRCSPLVLLLSAPHILPHNAHVKCPSQCSLHTSHSASPQCSPAVLPISASPQCFSSGLITYFPQCSPSVLLTYCQAPSVLPLLPVLLHSSPSQALSAPHSSPEVSIVLPRVLPTCPQSGPPAQPGRRAQHHSCQGAGWCQCTKLLRTLGLQPSLPGLQAPHICP